MTHLRQLTRDIGRETGLSCCVVAWHPLSVHDPTYVARFGWTPRDLLLLPFSALFVIGGGMMLVDGSPVVGALLVLLGAGYILLSLTAWLSRRVALAVTPEGITLGMAPPWPASRSAFVPWSDIEAVVLWRQAVRHTSIRYVGILRRADAPPLPGSASSPTLRRINKALVPAHLSEALVADSRPVSSWRLNKTRLTTAVNQFAPDVPVMDHT